MCFKKPKPPSVTTPADPELALQRMAAEQDNAVVKAEAKRIRTEDQLALLQGKVGRKSLFTGGQGGRGYSGARSLFNVTSYSPGRRQVNPGPPPGTGGGGDGLGTSPSGPATGSPSTGTVTGVYRPGGAVGRRGRSVFQ